MMTTGLETAQVTMPSDTQVRVDRAFRAPRERVWRAYTTPELMRRWLLGPPGWEMPVCEMDVRPGGSFRWRWRSLEDGKEFGFFGEYQEVEAPARIKSTEAFDPGTIGGAMGDEAAIITVTLSEQDGVTTMSTLMEYDSKKSRDEAIATGMTDGMETSYQLLDNLLAEQARA